METVGTVERVILLEGGRNFRDLGGYVARDGRRLKWGRLYRSGSMAALTEAAYVQLAELGVRVICDLRTTSERETSPVDWRKVPNLSYWARDYDLSFGDLRAVIASDLPTAEQASAAMVTAYRELPFEQAPAYGELFRRLADGEAPLVFNCSAGKDRTGVAAALILQALGVPEETIVEDYLLSNLAYDRAASATAAALAHIDPEVTAAILGVDDRYIRAALAAIDDAHGSVERYLQDQLGLTGDALGRLEAHLLE
ncbi:tyrosine-protein phosphatase [Phenylobacterium sp. LjRoot225]|uniref:tyrosine-protein phosphatase n=1 Tax=Phenylobacterium sp. LjRoot225 TaxID=3342285 RepID=UPI003ECD563E